MGKWSPLAAVCLGAFMLLVDITIIVVALPDMARDLGASFTGLQWVLDAYALALAALVLGAGSLADQFGRRKVYLAGLVVFAVASLACGLAPDAPVLIAARAVQGIGGAAMLATTMALINVTYHGRDRAVALGIWGAIIGIAASAGPVLGGLFTEYVHWRAIFLVNLPISLLAIWMTTRAIGESRNPHSRGIDIPGVVTFTAAAGAITYGLIQAGEDGWAAASTLGWLIGGLVALVAFAVIQIRSDHAMLDLTLFRKPSFAIILVAALAMSFAAFGYNPFLSIWLQNSLGLAPLDAGLALLPMSVASFLVASTIGRHLHSVPARYTIGIGMVLIGAGALLLHTGSSWVAVLPGLAVAGVGVGVTGQALPGAMMATVPPSRAGMASGALNTFRQLGFALGVAVLGTIVRGGRDFNAGVEGSYVLSGVVGLVTGVVVLLFLRMRRTEERTPSPGVVAAEA